MTPFSSQCDVGLIDGGYIATIEMPFVSHDRSRQFFFVGEKENILISQWGWEIPRRKNTSKVHEKINKCIFEEFYTLKGMVKWK